MASNWGEAKISSNTKSSTLFSKNETAINIIKLFLTDKYSHSAFSHFLLQTHANTQTHLHSLPSEEIGRAGMLLCLLQQASLAHS